jgi:peptide/nickel transport system permease protein
VTTTMAALITAEHPPELGLPPARTRHPLARMITRRLAAGLATLLVCSALIFLACNILPGNVATAVLGKNATPERVARVRQLLGLNQSVPERYLHWLGGILTGNLGKSGTAIIVGGNASISKQLVPALTNSLTLAGITLILLIPLSIALGTLAGLRAGKATDHATSAGTLLLGSLPEFVLGTVLILIFFQLLGWFPPVSLLAPGASPLGHPSILVLPIATLLGVSIAGAARQIRAGVIEVSREDYVGLARINGLPERKVLVSYTIRNALAPSVQIMAQGAQYLIGGIIIVESVFNYPGIGSYLVTAVSTRDVPVIESAAVILAGLYILINIIADVLVVLLVPVLRTAA